MGTEDEDEEIKEIIASYEDKIQEIENDKENIIENRVNRLNEDKEMLEEELSKDMVEEDEGNEKLLLIKGAEITIYSPDHKEIEDVVKTDLVEFEDCEIRHSHSSFDGKSPFIMVKHGGVIRFEDIFLFYLRKESEDDIGIVDLIAKNDAEFGFNGCIFLNGWGKK